MEALVLIIRIFFYLSIFFLLLGMWRPWAVLWWMPYQNRLLVLKYYGTIMLASAIVLLLQ